MPSRNFGERVMDARAMHALSIDGAAAMLEMPVSLLEDIEAGLVPMNPQLQVIFEKLYGIDLAGSESGAREHVERRPISYDAEAGILQLEHLGVRFRVGEDDNDVLFRGFSSAVRRLRGLAPGAPIRLRAADMPILAKIADLEDGELDDRARFWFGQDDSTAQSFSTLLRLSRSPDTVEDVWAI